MHVPSLEASASSLSVWASLTASLSLSVASERQVPPSRSSSQTNSVPVLNLQDAAACATQSPEFRIWAPAADKPPPYRSIPLVKSMSNSPLRAKALPESINGIAAGLSELYNTVLLLVFVDEGGHWLTNPWVAPEPNMATSKMLATVDFMTNSLLVALQ